MTARDEAWLWFDSHFTHGEERDAFEAAHRHEAPGDRDSESYWRYLGDLIDDEQTARILKALA